MACCLPILWTFYVLTIAQTKPVLALDVCVSCIFYINYRASQVALIVKNSPAKQETRLPSLGREDPLEEEMATHSSILAWEIPWTEEPGGLQSTGSQKSLARLSDWTAATILPGAQLGSPSHLPAF